MLKIDLSSHTYYYWDGETIPSVTQIIGEWRPVSVYGVEYYVNTFTGHVVDAERFREARDWGNAVHKMLALYLHRKLDESSLHESLIPILEQFDEWMRLNHVEPLEIEKPLYNEQYRYAGTPDLICKLNGRLSIVDYKTGSYDMAGPQLAAYYKTGSYDMAGPQLAAYCMLYKPLVGKDRYVLHIPRRDSKINMICLRNFTDDWNFFRARLHQYLYLKSKNNERL